MKPILLRLELQQYERLRLLSFVNRKPVSQIIREAIDDYLHEHQAAKPGQEWFWSEGWQAAEREVEEDLAASNFETFDTIEDFLESLE